MRSAFRFVGRVLLLSVILLALFAVSEIMVGAEAGGVINDPGEVLFFWAALCLPVSFALSLVAVRSIFSGAALWLVLFAVMFGLMTLLPQIQNWVVMELLSSQRFPVDPIRLGGQGLVTAALFSISTVLVFRKNARDRLARRIDQFYAFTTFQYLMRVMVAALLYMALNAVSSFFVYEAATGATIFESLGRSTIPEWFLLVQLGRGLIWALLGLLLARVVEGNYFLSGLIISLNFAILMGVLLLIPSPFISEELQMATFLDVLAVNFIFGWIVVLLFKPGLRRRKRTFI